MRRSNFCLNLVQEGAAAQAAEQELAALREQVAPLEQMLASETQLAQEADTGAPACSTLQSLDCRCWIAMVVCATATSHLEMRSLLLMALLRSQHTLCFAAQENTDKSARPCCNLLNMFKHPAAFVSQRIVLVGAGRQDAEARLQAALQQVQELRQVRHPL